MAKSKSQILQNEINSCVLNKWESERRVFRMMGNGIVANKQIKENNFEFQTMVDIQINKQKCVFIFQFNKHSKHKSTFIGFNKNSICI